MDDFISGDFSQGGSAGWFELQQEIILIIIIWRPHRSLKARIDNAQGEEMKLLDWGNGFCHIKNVKNYQTVPTGRLRCKCNARKRYRRSAC